MAQKQPSPTLEAATGPGRQRDAIGVADTLAAHDPLIADALAREARRQHQQLELIASENIVSPAVLAALGHSITNKTLEGYPGRRFHGGGQFVDVIERAAIDRACQVFDCAYANVQPHSGTQANQAVFFALLQPGDRVLSLDLAAGGHLSHGAAPNQSGRWFDALHYGVERDTGLIDYDQLDRQANEVRPRLMIAGGSAYPREFDFPRLREIADKCGAVLLVDMAHFAGLVAARVHPDPLPHADIVTCTTTKTLRGPRGGLILSRDQAWAKKLQSAVFPGVQGSLHTQIIAAKAVCLGEALRPEFKDYGASVKRNAAVLGATLVQRQIDLVSGGTDTHLVLIDLSSRGLTGAQVQDALERVDITSNRNPVPFDARNPDHWVGLRLGSAAVTTRGFAEAQMVQLGNLIGDVIDSLSGNRPFNETAAREAVAELCRRYPAYAEPAD